MQSQCRVSWPSTQIPGVCHYPQGRFLVILRSLQVQLRMHQIQVFQFGKTGHLFQRLQIEIIEELLRAPVQGRTAGDFLMGLPPAPILAPAGS